MKFSREKNLTFEQATALMFEQLGQWKIMALASSVNDYVMVRNVSCLFYDKKSTLRRTKISGRRNSFLKIPGWPCAGAASRWRGLPETWDL